MIDGRRARSAASLEKLVAAWVHIARLGGRPTLPMVVDCSGVSAASLSRLTSMHELEIVGTERMLRDQAAVTIAADMVPHIDAQVQSITVACCLIRERASGFGLSPELEPTELEATVHRLAVYVQIQERMRAAEAKVLVPT